MEARDVSEWKYLASGVDTLELGLYVEWGPDWAKTAKSFDAGKAKAVGTDGLPFGGQACLIQPYCKAPTYRWKLQWPEFQLDIAKGQAPRKNTPNVFASINAEPLWMRGVSGAIQAVVAAIEGFGGKVVQIKPSRCDLCADFLLPGGLSLDFLLSHYVPQKLATRHFMSASKLETFYAGAKDGPIQLRIYDKGKEVSVERTKLWFLSV